MFLQFRCLLIFCCFLITFCKHYLIETNDNNNSITDNNLNDPGEVLELIKQEEGNGKIK